MQYLTTRIALFFAENKQLSLLLVISIFIFGILSYIATPKQYNPQITLPAYRISTFYPGATAKEVETLVTSEIERKISEIPGIDEVFSQSLPERSFVTVLFRVGEDPTKSWAALSEKINANMHLAPMGVHSPLLQNIDPETVPIITFAIKSTQFTDDSLRLLAFDLREKLSNIAGVTEISITGGKTRQLRIEPDPERMTSRGISVSDIIYAVKQNNMRVRAGSLEGDFVNTPIELEGTLISGEVLQNLQVRGNGSSTVRLQDIATIIDGYENSSSISRYREKEEDQQHAIFLSIAKLKGENGVSVSARIHERINELQSSFIPSGIEIETLRDEGRTAKEEIGGLVQNLATSIVIVLILLFAFLELRAALIVAIAIPMTFSLVLSVGYFYGQTINRITLFALILSLGLLVDSAIVIVENITRHLSENKKTSAKIVSNSVGEVGASLVLSTLTSVIVFLPMGAVTGMMGAYMGPIAFFVPAALMASLLIAITLTPYLSFTFLKPKNENQKNNVLQRLLLNLEQWYSNLLSNILNNPVIQKRMFIGAFIFIIVSFSFPVLELLQFRMLPKADKEQFAIYIDAPSQTPTIKMDEYAHLIENVLLENSNVLSVQTTIGIAPVTDFNGLFKGSDLRISPFQATLTVNLTHPSDRWLSSQSIVHKLRPALQTALKQEPDIRLRLLEDPPGPPVLSTLLVRVKGTDSTMRQSISRDILSLFRSTDGVVDFDSTIPTGSTQKLLNIDHAKVSHSGLSVSQVEETLRAGLDGISIGTAHINSPEQTEIFLRYPKNAHNEASDLSRLTVRNTVGDMVSIQSLVSETDVQSPATIWHDENERTTMVLGEMDERPVIYAVKDIFFTLLSYRLPDGNGELISISPFGLTYLDTKSREQYRIEWGGEFEMTLENFRDLGIAMILAFFLVYMLLVAQFKSFSMPILIMSSIVLAFGGVLVGFAFLNLFGIKFSATSMIGMIALGGIVVNNAIILLEFIQEKIKEGLATNEAIIQAGTTRLRPILLTTLTTVLGSLTIVGDPVWSGLAWSIIFGLSISTVLTLVFFPILTKRFMRTL